VSYESISGEAARCSLRERLEDDSAFALSLSQATQPSKLTPGALIEDENVDGEVYDDDPALTTECLVNTLLNNPGMAMNSPDQLVVSPDDDNSPLEGSGVDDELMDSSSEESGVASGADCNGSETAGSA